MAAMVAAFHPLGLTRPISLNAMLRPLFQLADRHSRHLPGWMMLMGGMTLLACAVLLPAWLEARELTWHRNVMQLQHDRLLEQENNYIKFRQALADDDPAVLTRLAFTRLRQKPLGASPIGLATIDPHLGYAIRFVSDPNDIETCIRLIRESLDHPSAGDIDAWLHLPMPQLGQDYHTLPVVRGRIVRIATGNMRMPLAAAGLLCVVAGLLPPTRF